MPSAALTHWMNDRMPRLAEVDAHCAAVHALGTPTPFLAEESLSAYVMLLSGHFQGFCRDLYTDCSQILIASLPITLQVTVQAQFFAELKLNTEVLHFFRQLHKNGHFRTLSSGFQLAH